MSDAVTRLNTALEGRYEIERELGEGGMATVYLAKDLKHNRNVALKVLKPELAAVVGAERFLAEIETTANLQHPHILPLFDSGEADSFLFYVMPYVEGETLRERLEREKQLPVEEAVRIASDIAEALDHAHRQGVVHRDIKPANILLRDGRPLVADFGIALAVGAAGGARLTETGLSVGTPFYMSPEQATGDQQVGPPGDTYALAAVLYEMLVGEPPYLGNTAQAVLGKIIQGAPVSATAVRKSIPRNVDAAIRKALEKIPADRFAGAQDFAKALSDSGFRHGGEAGAGLAGRASSWNPLTLAFAALAGVFAIAAAGAFTDSPPPPTVERFGTPFLDGQEPLGTGGANFTLSSDGTMAVYVGPAGQSGGIQLWVRRWGDLEASPIRGTEGGNQPDISPDGSEVAFQRGDQIHVVPLAGGPVRNLTRGQWPEWDGNGQLYAMLGAVGSVRVPAAGGPVDTLTLLQDDDQNHLVSEVLPGGRGALLVVPRGSGGVEIRALDLESGAMTFLVDGGNAQYVDTGHIVYVFDGSLMAVPFDPAAMELVGPSVALEPDVNAQAVSRSGRLLYTTGSSQGPDRQLMWVTRSGDAESVDPAWTFRRGDTNVSWSLSPDDSRLVLREQNDGAYDIWVKQLDDGPRSRLTFDDAGDYFPQWTPDGDAITYVSGSPTAMNVYTRRADGTGESELLLDIDESVALAYWSPDREWLILRTTTGAGNVFGRNIVAIRPGTDTLPLPLMVEEYDETDPALSPDGRWIAYASNETGQYEVYVRPFPDVDSGRWQISTNGGTRPLWANSGREIFFKDGNANMMATEVDGSGSAFEAGNPDVLFSIPSDYEMRMETITMPYDVSSDDQRFIMGRIVRDDSQASGNRPDFVLVQNFSEELKQRVPRN